MTPVRLEPAAPRSRVKHSTTEPLHSRETDFSLVLKDSDMESENLSYLIGLSVSGGQKTDSSKDVSLIGI